MRFRVGYAIAAALLCIFIIVPFVATEAKASTETIIPVGEYTTLSKIPIPPPTIPHQERGFDLFYNVGWDVDGGILGNPIDIYVLNDSNFQKFKNNQQYSVFQDLFNVNGSFKMHVVFPSNGPCGMYVFQEYNTTNSWWIVFDNTAGSSNVTLHIDNNWETCPSIWIPLPTHDWALLALVAMGAVLGVLFVVTRGERLQSSTSKGFALS